MRNVFPLPVLLMAFAAATTSAAISIGTHGSATHSFTNLPAVGEWATRSLPGTETSFGSAATLHAAVQTNSATELTTPLVDALGAHPPAQNTLGSWSSGGTGALWTRPAANGATLLMATLQNDSGLDQNFLRLSYTLGQSGSSPSEQSPAHQVYYNLSGATGSWINLPALSGGGAGFRSNLVSLSTTWLQGAPLYILWADDNTPGGVDRGYSLDDVFFSGKPVATLEAIPDFTVAVQQLVLFTAQGSNILPGVRLEYTLSSAPPAARLNATNGQFLWVPSRADAGTTNVIVVKVADLDAPSLFATRTFTVVVRDYVALSPGSTVLEDGQSSNVILQAVSTAALTNLAFEILFPAERLEALALENLLPAIATASIDTNTPGRIALVFNALPGQVLLGTQAIARLHFTATSGQRSAFVPLRTGSVSVERADAGLAPSLIVQHGRIVVVNNESLIEASQTPTNRTVTLFGKPGAAYTIEAATAVVGPWLPWRQVTVTNLVELLDASEGTNAPNAFYRAFEGTSLPPTLTSAAPAPTAFKAATKLQQRKAAALAKKLRKKAKGRPAAPSVLP